MKRCDYCAKEISYDKQYCDEDCQKKAIDYYELNEKYTKLFSVIDIICIFAIPVGFVIFSFADYVGFTMVAFAVAILGLMVVLLPFPTEDMISKFKIEKAVKITRTVGVCLLVLGIALIVCDMIFFI